MVEVVVSQQARTDLLDIIGYLATVASRGVTRSWHDRLWAAIDHLAEWPGEGAPRPKLGANVRIKIVGPYLVIYEHQRGDTTLQVLRVLYGSRRITRKLVRAGSR